MGSVYEAFFAVFSLDRLIESIISFFENQYFNGFVKMPNQKSRTCDLVTLHGKWDSAVSEGKSCRWGILHTLNIIADSIV